MDGTTIHLGHSFPILVKNVRQDISEFVPAGQTINGSQIVARLTRGIGIICVLLGMKSRLQFFLDGELLFSSQHSAETTFTEVPFEWTVGASARSHTYQFKGAIDEVGIWNRALTEEEILALYNAPAPTPGCTDWNADNYDPNANIEDGSCLYSGCFDMEADNYDSQANTGDQEALCEYNGCTNEAADNYDPNANVDDGSCVGEGCMTDVCEYYGCTDWNADNYNPNANIEDGSCLYSGCMDMEADNYDSQANTGDQEALCEYNGCTNEAADNYDPNANVDDGSCVGEGCMTDVCEYYGCTDWNADNYNPNANIEDGSCLYSGCMDMEADNYDSQANTGDQEALCEYNGCTNEAADNYDPHANEDNGTCIVPGCMYEEATNYNAAATYDNLSCEFMIPSVHCGEGTYWDDFAQACLTIVTCQEDLDGDGVIGINDLMELLSSFGTMCEEPETGEFTCGDPINYHGCDYATVQIGEQCWFAENLRTELYQNGDSIPLLESGWTQLSSPAFTSFNNDSELSDVYGYLYNWFAIAGSNICPVDWRVSTQQDFTILHQELGGEEIAGGRMKEEGVDFWQEPNEGATNSSGLTALPGGWLNGGSDEFFDLGLRAGWWTSSEYSVALGVGHWLLYNQENASFPGVDKKDGYSVRCIKDTEE